MRTRSAVLPFLVFASALFASPTLDTLKIHQSFDSPVPNPRAIVYDSPDFWIANQQKALLYKVDPQMRILDSIQLPFVKITGMTFKEDELWVVRDSSIRDSMIIQWNEYLGKNDSLYYPLYGLYRIDLQSGIVEDSIIIRSSATNHTSSFLWGIVYYESRFVVSYNGGYGPCIFSIDPKNGQATRMCCPHPSGMKIINDEFWCIRNTAPDGLGRILAILTSDESSSSTIAGIAEHYRYDLSFTASDLAYDGSTIWLVDPVNSKICMMEGFSTKTKDRIESPGCRRPPRISKFKHGMLTINPASGMDISSMELSNSRGVIIGKLNFSPKRYMEYNCSKIPSGVYFVKYTGNGNPLIEKVIIHK